MGDMTWARLGKEIDELLDLGYQFMTKGMKEGNFDYMERSRMFVQRAKLLWEQHKHLSPETVKNALGSWKNRQAMMTSGVRAGIPAPLPQNPVDIDATKTKGKIQFKKIDPKCFSPQIMILLSDWLVDYVYASYASQELQSQRRAEQEWANNWWVYYMRGYDAKGQPFEFGGKSRQNNIEYSRTIY